MKKCILIAVCFGLASLCFSVSRDRSIITYNLEYFSNGAQKELEFYITDSSVVVNNFDKTVLNAKKTFASDKKLHEDLSSDFNYRFRIDFYYDINTKKSYYVRNGFDVFDCKNKVSLELDNLIRDVYGNFSTYAVEHFYKEGTLMPDKLSDTKRVCFYLDSRPFAMESNGELCDRGNIPFFDCDLRTAPKIVNQIKNSRRIPNGFGIKEALIEGSYIMQIYHGDKVDKTFRIVNSKNAFDDSDNLHKVSVSDDLLTMCVEFMIANWL